MRKLAITLAILVILGIIVGSLWNFKAKVSGCLPVKVRDFLKNTLLDIRSKFDSGFFMVEMRDGVKLPTKVWRPMQEGEYPVVLERGYYPGNEFHAKAFTEAGYVYVGQKARGSLQDNMFFPDAKDGYDCLDWISRQPWCDGNIAMYGRSFKGATQWLVAPEQHPNLKAIIPQNINDDLWERCYWDHGALQLAHTARRIYDIAGTDKVERFGGWEKFHRHLPLINLDEAIGTRNQLWKNYVTHSTYDDFWKRISIRDKYNKINIPVYIMGGWYDNYPGAAFSSFQSLIEHGAADEIRIIINPTNHSNKVVGDRDFGNDAHKDELLLAVRWLDYVIKGIDNGIKDEPPVKIFVMGANIWRGENKWPLARTQFTNYYLHSTDSMNGWLSTQSPGNEPPTKYKYDPNDPVPSLGGNHSSPYIPGILRVGALDQRPIEKRQDVLVFTSAPLEEDVEVTGPVRVVLYAASSVRDTDFICRLTDVYTDGTSFNLTEGIIRARFRESIWNPPKLLKPGEIYKYIIDLQPTSNVFKRGHSLRVHITSSGFPLWDRNPNTGNKQGMDAEMIVADQTIYHDMVHPSHIILPVIPSNR